MHIQDRESSSICLSVTRMSHINLNTATENESISNALDIKLPTTGMNLVILNHLCIAISNRLCHSE